MTQHRIWQVPLLLAVTGATLLSSCKKTEDAVKPTPTPVSTSAVTDQDVNKWILDSMQTYYYWTDKIPANPDKTLKPTAFFNSLLYKWDKNTRPDGDRNSLIDESVDNLIGELNGQTKSIGMRFTLLRRSAGSNNVVALVEYVFPGSPAAVAGMRRGDIYYKLNGQTITIDNYRTLLGSSTTTFAYTVANLTTSGLVDGTTVKTATAVDFQENPVGLDTVYTIGAKKIGYFFYTNFIPRPNGNSTASARTYDQQVEQVFGRFKQQGVNELVLDLRYNTGGDGQSAVTLASLITKANTNQVFFSQDYNKYLTAAFTQQYGANFGKNYFQPKANNIGANLQRVFVLTSGNTASASELVINGLKPFMNVVLVGDTTYGKNVGSITIYDKRKPRVINYGLQPIITKVYNSLGQSDYTAGFAPNVVFDEFRYLPFGALGDIKNESLLNEAIYQATGTRTVRLAARPSTANLIGRPLVESGTTLGGKGYMLDLTSIIKTRK